MTSNLHEVSPEELARGTAIENWLKTFSTASSKRSMLSSLRAIIRAAYGIERDAPVRVAGFEWELLADAELFGGVMDRLTARYGRQHATKYVVAMRSLLKSLASVGVADYASTSRTLADIKVRRLESEAPDLAISTDDIWRLLRHCHHDPNQVVGRRDLALFSLTASTGARRSEIVQVEICDLNIVKREVRLDVKGGGERIASFHPSTSEHLEQWLKLRGDGGQYLFPSLRRGGHIEETALSDHQFWKVFRRRCHQVGIDDRVTPHELRRWFVSTLLDSGVDIFSVSRVVGHSRIETTFRYDRRAKMKLRAVVDKLDLPGMADLDQPEKDVT
jgi:site-specific recombinase XerD